MVMAKSKTATLKLIASTSGAPSPPADLAEAGVHLWRSITAEYVIDDAAAIALLAEACRAADRAAQCAAAIGTDGLVVATVNGPRDHPLLKHEIANRAFCVRTLQKLGLNFEPVRPTGGRPPGRGW